MVIDIGVIEDLSGLAKAITYTIRVMFRTGLKLSYVKNLSRYINIFFYN
jgi:hypothetical protein